jgi:L-asparaginase II
MPNPVIAEVTRGSIVESRHRGAFAVTDASGKILKSAGDIEALTYPRSAIKAFQCLPLIQSGAADRFGLTLEELALCCASHNGEAGHVRVARSILAKAGRAEEELECGAHWPNDMAAQQALWRQGKKPTQIHNNCSGKHAGMLALATHLKVALQGYVELGHPVQQRMAESLSDLCGVDAAKLPVGIDGCSVPTWAVPLKALAHGFARLTQRPAGARIIAAVRAHPVMVGGSEDFDTALMQAVPRAFVKTGAEGVYGACVPHTGLGIALKCDDGAGRAAEVAIARALASLDVWDADERTALEGFALNALANWRKIPVGEVVAIRF